MLVSGQVVAAHGRHYLVETPVGEQLTCFPRGKTSLLACGDRVLIQPTAPGQAALEAVDPRRSLLYRSDLHRQKLIAANVTQMVVVLAAVPTFYEELLNRCLVAAEHQGIRVLIVLNKFDLMREGGRVLDRLDLYAALGYTVLPLAAKRDIGPLHPHLAGQLSVLVGQSGMGKSTIINGLVPEAGAKVAEVSLALDSGRHTTTHAKLYRLDPHSALIDSPGMQEFGLAHLTQAELQQGFVEFRPLLGWCRFNDCRHVHEPDCAIARAVLQEKIDGRRLSVYRKLADELARAKRYER